MRLYVCLFRLEDVEDKCIILCSAKNINLMHQVSVLRKDTCLVNSYGPDLNTIGKGFAQAESDILTGLC